MLVREQVAGFNRVTEVLRSGIFSQKKIEVYVGRFSSEVGCLVRVVSEEEENMCTIEVNETMVLNISVVHVQEIERVMNLVYQKSEALIIYVQELASIIITVFIVDTMDVCPVLGFVYRDPYGSTGEYIWWRGRPPDVII